MHWPTAAGICTQGGPAYIEVLDLVPQRGVLAVEPLPLIPQLLHLAVPAALFGLQEHASTRHVFGWQGIWIGHLHMLQLQAARCIVNLMPDAL